jgi:predicted GTPase
LRITRWLLTTSLKFINRILEGAQVHPESAPKMEVAIGGDMNSCTKDIQDVIVLKTTDDALNEALSGRRLVLVDTPGFNDAKMSDQEILRRVSHWLASA